MKSAREESELSVTVLIEGILRTFFLDCGSYHNLITAEALKNVNPGTPMRATQVKLGAAKKTPLKLLGEASLPVELGTRSLVVEFIVVDGLSDPVVFGKKGTKRPDADSVVEGHKDKTIHHEVPWIRSQHIKTLRCH